MTIREDILTEFAMEETINHSVLRKYILQYPKLAEDLLDLFHECYMADLEAEVSSMQLASANKKLDAACDAVNAAENGEQNG